MRKTIIALMPAVCWCLQAAAQQPVAASSQNKTPKKSKKPEALFSLGAGGAIPGGAATRSAWLTRSPTVNAGLFIPFYTKYPPGGSVSARPLLSIGVNITAVYYADGGRNPVSDLPPAYNITGQTASRMSYRGNHPGNPGYSLAAGPQLTFYMGRRFSLSAAVPVGYTNITKKAGSAVQTAFFTDSAGRQTSCDFSLNSMSATRVKGISISPSARLQYMVTQRAGIWAEASWLMGPAVITENTVLIPNGSPGPGGTYPLQALITGTYSKNTPVTSRFSAAGFSGGIVIRFGGKRSTESSAGTIDESKDAVWDGKLKNLHRAASGLLVPNKGGLNALADQINAGGKSTASVQRYNDRTYLKVMTKYTDSTVSEFYAADTSQPLGLMLPSGRPTLSCRNGGCTNCVAEGDAGHEHCECRMPPNPNAAPDPYHPLRDCFATATRLTAPDRHFTSLASIPVSLDATAAGGALTAADKQKIKDVILKYFQTAQVTSIELLKEGKRRYVKADAADRGLAFSLVTEVELPRRRGRFDFGGNATLRRGWYIEYCDGNCDVKNPTGRFGVVGRKDCGTPMWTGGGPGPRRLVCSNCIPNSSQPGPCTVKVKWVRIEEFLNVPL